MLEEGARPVSVNDLGQPVGPALLDWEPRPEPPRTPLQGRACRLEPLHLERHSKDLFEAFEEDPQGRLWTYMPYGPFETLAAYRAFVERDCLGDDPLFYAVLDEAQGRASGVASLLRVAPDIGVMEVGHICYGPRLQRTRAATEAMYLLMGRAFDELGYRRYEWKCDALNAASRAAALRLGFRFEGVFRQATIYKNRSRDTAWFSIIDREWPERRRMFERWLAPANFDARGAQRQGLSSLVRAQAPQRPSGEQR